MKKFGILFLLVLPIYAQTINPTQVRGTAVVQTPTGTQNVGGILTVNSLMPTATAPGSAPNIIWDDDCDTDPGCFMTQAALMHWVDAKQVNLLAVTADSTNQYAAPALSIINSYYGYNAIPVGAYQGGTSTGAGSFSAQVVSQFRPGDTRTNYPSCVTTMRTVLAAAANSSVTLVGTGYAYCLRALQTSAADGISSLTGAQLIQAKVNKYVQMGGDYPSAGGSGACNAGFPPAFPEFNFCDHDPADFSAMYAAWTTANGYPPVYFVGYTAGINGGNAGIPTSFPLTNPAQYGVKVSTFSTRPSWDTLALWYAIFGNVGGAFTISASGTNTVNASTGANTWSSSPAAGQYYLTDAQPPPFYQSFLDGQTARGADWFMPYNQPGFLLYPGIECSLSYGCLYGGDLSSSTVGPYSLSYGPTGGIAINKAAGSNMLDLQQNGVSKLVVGVDDGTGTFMLGTLTGDGGIRLTSGQKLYITNAFGSPVAGFDPLGAVRTFSAGPAGSAMSMDDLSGGRVTAKSATTSTTDPITIQSTSSNLSVIRTALLMNPAGFVQLGGTANIGLDQSGNSTWTATRITSLAGAGSVMACIDASGNIFRGTATTCP